MRQFRLALVIVAALSFWQPPVFAGNNELHSCDVCTCTSGDIVCVDVEMSGEVLEEQVVCGIACQNIGSSHGTRERVEAACAELPQCNGLSAPAANPYWMTAAAVGLLLFGTLTVRRMRQRSGA